MRITGKTMQERLQKIIAEAGLMSRRAAEKLISEGKVLVNGVPASLGDKADRDTDRILVNGKELPAPEEQKTYIMLNKPKGYVTTMKDEKGRKDVSMLVEELGIRLFPVGRLDINSEGLLIMTNDGEFANRLMHPANNILKTYKVYVSSPELNRGIERLKEPFILDGIQVQAKNVSVQRKEENRASVLVTIGEGKNREIRRMCQEAGLKVTGLIRIREGSLELGSLKSGDWRFLTRKEVESFRKETER